MKKRIIKKDNRYFPQYYSNGFFGIGKRWRYYEDEGIMLNGIFTELTRENLSYYTLKQAKDFIKSLDNKPVKVVYEK
jgi:hypothetical protein